jgi:hypothetical protein
MPPLQFCDLTVHLSAHYRGGGWVFMQGPAVAATERDGDGHWPRSWSSTVDHAGVRI